MGTLSCQDASTYRDCRGLDADGTLVRINELVEEGLGTLIQRTQQQAVFYKALPAFAIEDSLRSHGIAFDEYRKQFFEVDYKVIESQRTAIHNANPDRPDSFAQSRTRRYP